jgi:hypothetical protein
LTRKSRLGSAGSARRWGRDAAVSRWTGFGFESAFGSGLVGRGAAADGVVAAGVDGCWVIAGVSGATCATGGGGVDCCCGVVVLASGAGSGATEGACGAASGCGSTAETVPGKARNTSERARVGKRAPGAANTAAARLRERGGAFGSKRVILLDLQGLSAT